jgi:glycosyltransferase involved in cell wall biosynthesis
MSAPALSVVVPVRNDPGHLAECLRGLAASTLRDHEVIVVDDASTDGTAAVAEAAGARLVRQAERTGPAAARNRGVREARAPLVLFVDADVRVHPDTLERVVAGFADPSVDALFGSYDLTPGSPNFLSQYKNLFHHYVHQRSTGEATTFWSGCGAIRRDVFLGAGGFDTSYRRPAIEDIELGVRLIREGRRIAVRKDVLATHLKRWTLPGLLASDIRDRGIPWTQLILREGRLPNDLNLQTAERARALLACAVALLAVGVIAGPFVPRSAWLAALAAATAVFVAASHRFYRFFVRHRGFLFAARVVPLHVAYYLYSLLAFAIGVVRHLAGPRRAAGALEPR